MKNLLALLLAFMMVLSLAACGGGSETDTDTETETESETESEAPVGNTFEPRDETVYIVGTNGLNIRTQPKVASDNLITSKEEGFSFKRIGYNEKWSKVIFDGKECYASSAYLSTLPPPVFTDLRETVYVKVESSVYVREKPWTEAEALASLADGTSVIRTGTATTADEFGSYWSRVEFADAKGNAKVGYINSFYLTTKAPLEFQAVSEKVTVTNCETLNLRAGPSLASNSIATLHVGDELDRIGIATSLDDEDILWSKITYQGKTGYVSSVYLATKSTPATFTADSLSIVLSEEYEAAPADVVAAMGCDAAFGTEEVQVLVQKITPEMLSNVSMTAEEYAALTIELNSLGTEIVKRDGLITFTYNIISEGLVYTIFASTYKSIDAIWVVQFMATFEVFPAHEADIWGYAKSVTFR